MSTDTPLAARSKRRSVVLAYLLLGKARIYQHSWGLVLAVLLVSAAGRWSSGMWVALLFSFVALQAVQFSAGAADDLGGFRDGSDAQNYAGRPAVTVAKKPLLTGALTERHAVRFIIGCYAVGIVSCVAGAWVSGVRSFAAVVAMFVVATVVVQYSLGAKLSYRPLGLEATVFVSTGAVVLIPYWLATGSVSLVVVLTSALFGTWFLMVVCYGNASDIAGDKAVSRMTLAVLLSPTAYKVFLSALYLVELALVIGVFACGDFVSMHLIATMAPVVAVHTVQLYFAAVGDRWRRARLLGILSLDLGGIGLVAAALLS